MLHVDVDRLASLKADHKLNAEYSYDYEASSNSFEYDFASESAVA